MATRRGKLNEFLGRFVGRSRRDHRRREHRHRAPARALPRPGRRPATAGAARRAHRDRPALHRGMAARPGGRRLRRVRRRERHLLDDRGAGVRAGQPGRRRLRARRVRAGARRAEGERPDRRRVQVRRGHRLARARRGCLRRLRAVLPARLCRQPGADLAARARRRRGEAAGRREGRRPRLRPRRLDRAARPGVPGVEVQRVRLPRAVDRAGAQARRRRRRRRPGAVRGGEGGRVLAGRTTT